MDQGNGAREWVRGLPTRARPHRILIAVIAPSLPPLAVPSSPAHTPPPPPSAPQAVDMPGLKAYASHHVERFIADPQARRKDVTPNLGVRGKGQGAAVGGAMTTPRPTTPPTSPPTSTTDQPQPAGLGREPCPVCISSPWPWCLLS